MSEQDLTQMLGVDVASYAAFMRGVGRTSYNRGLLRFLAPAALRSWNGPGGWKGSWNRWSNRLIAFGMDWQARQFCFDLERVDRGEPLISMLDVGGAELFETPTTFHTFVEDELVQYPDETMSASHHAEWLRAGGPPPREDQCVSYRQPLFLGGTDDIANRELSDVDVYVSLLGQLWAKVAELPEGTPLGRITIS